MYTSSRRNSTGSEAGETDKDRKMRLVGDSNRRAGRQLTKQLQDIDKHLQVNLRQINGDMEINSSTTSPPLSSPSPKYLASSTDSGESANHSSPRSQKLHRGVDPTNNPTQGQPRTTVRKLKSSSNQSKAEGKDMETKFPPPREKTFTIIDHGLASADADSVTDNYPGPEGKARSRTLDVLDNRRLVQATGEKPRRANIRNEMINMTSTRNKPVRRDFVINNRVQQSGGKLNKNNGRNLDSELHKIPGYNQEQKSYITGKIVPNNTGETLEYHKQAFNLNDSGNVRQRGKKVSVNNNNGQILAKDELDRRQLRKMHILSNLNKKHMDRDPSSEDMEVFIKRDYDVRVSRNVPLLPSPPRNDSPDIVIDTEKPRPKSAMFSSQRRPRFTSEEDDNVFLDDLDIIDIDDDGESDSDDEDVLNSSFVAPLKPSSRHPLGLHTRSTSDISPSTFRRGDDAHFRISKALHRGNERNILKMSDQSRDSIESNLSSNLVLSETDSSVVRRKSVIENIGGEKDKAVTAQSDSVQSIALVPTANTKGDISPKSGTNNSFKRRNKTDTSEKDNQASNPKPAQESGRPLPAFPRKLKPLFKSENLTPSEDTEHVSQAVNEERRISDSTSPTSPKSDSYIVSQNQLQRSSSQVYHNKKLQRSRQKTWTAGVRSTGARDLLKRPLPPTSLGPKPRVKSDLGDVMTRSVTRRRARTSSELKKCSSKELETLKTGNTTSSVDSGNTTTGPDDEMKPVEISEGLRNCRYLRTTKESDSLSAVNVESC